MGFVRDIVHNMLYQTFHLIDKSRVVGTILMKLSKVFDCLPHDLVTAKLHAYGSIRPRLIWSYLSDRHQRIKLDSAFSSWMQTISGIQ